MRADLQKIVWEARFPARVRSWKFVLLNLCHHANAAGEAFPSVSLIVRETGYSKKAVLDALEGLRLAGLIARTGACGSRNRVGVYDVNGLSTAVHNFANGKVSTPLAETNGVVSTPLKASNGVLSSPNGVLSTPRSILGNKRVSKLVSGGANGVVSTPFVHNSGGGGASGEPSVAPSARKEGTPSASVPGGAPDYFRLLRTVGWKPRQDADRRACAARCFEIGADSEQAKAFVRFNAIRRWTCCEYGTVNDAAKAWVEKWKDDEPEAFWAERNRRKAGAR